MAFYDWNKDGKKDVQDDFIEYNIYSESMKNNNGNPNNNSGGRVFGLGGCDFDFARITVTVRRLIL